PEIRVGDTTLDRVRSWRGIRRPGPILSLEEPYGVFRQGLSRVRAIRFRGRATASTRRSHSPVSNWSTRVPRSRFPTGADRPARRRRLREQAMRRRWPREDRPVPDDAAPNDNCVRCRPRGAPELALQREIVADLPPSAPPSGTVYPAPCAGTSSKSSPGSPAVSAAIAAAAPGRRIRLARECPSSSALETAADR